MTSKSDLKSFFDRGRPLVEQWLDLADEFKNLRDEARTKEVDWVQVKGLLKAVVQDERDGGERVKKLLDRADTSTAYADMLGLLSTNPEEKITRTTENAPPDDSDIPTSLRRGHPDCPVGRNAPS